MNRKVLWLITMLFLSNNMFSKTLKVKVIDGSNNQPLSNVEVMVVGFIEGSGEPAFHLCDVKKTGVSGEAIFSSDKLVDVDPVSGLPVVYKIGFSKNRYIPTIKEQISRNLIREIKFLPSINLIDLTNTPFIMFLPSANFQIGELEFDIYNSVGDVIPNPLVGVLELKHSVTQEIAAFKVFIAPGMNPIDIQNIPPAEAGVYKLSVYIPSTKEGAEIIVSTAVYNNQRTKEPEPIYLGYVSNARSEGNQPSISPMDIAFEGIVLDKSSKPISNCYVEVRDVDSSRSNLNFFITMTEPSGRFFVPKNTIIPSTFSVLVSRLGYKAKFDKPGYGYYYDGVNRIVLPRYILEESTGVIKGKILVKNKNSIETKGFPDVEITFCPERYLNWSGQVIIPSESGEYRTKSRGDGSFEIKGISPGYYNLVLSHPLLATNTSYWKGNGEPNPSQPWNYKYEYNLGENQIMELTNSFRSGDDRLIVITSDTFKSIVYNNLGAILVPEGADINVILEVQITTNAVIKGNFYFPTSVDIAPEDAIKVIAHPFDPVSRDYLEWSGRGTVFLADPNGLYGSGNHKPIYIEVSTGVYHIEIKSDKWVPVRNYNTTVIISTPGSVAYLPDIYLTKAGRLEGKIKLPDGSYFQAKEFNDGSWLEGEIRVEGVNVDFSKDFKLRDYSQDPTKFIFDALPAGMYNLTVQIRKGLQGERNAKELYPPIVISNVRVYAGQTTYVESAVKDGVLCEPLSPIPPDRPEVDYSQRAGKDLSPNYGIIGFPTELALKGQILQYLINNQGVLEDIQVPILGFDIRTKKWQQTKVVPGKYNFYLVLLRLFGPDVNAGPDEYVTVLSKAENVSIKTEDLVSGNTFQIQMGAGVMGTGIVTGRVKGSMILTAQDSEKIRNNFKEFLNYIPTVMLYDMYGNWRGYSAVRPKLTDLPKWEVSMNKGDVWMINNMINSDDDNISSPVSYYIDNLPIGKYILVCETKNYPVVTKIVEVSTGITKIDINFDEDAPQGVKLTGYVKDENNFPISNANIVITHRLTTKKTITDTEGKFEIFGLPSGVVKIDVSKDGYAICGEKVSLGKEDKEVNIKLKKAEGKILGKIYVRESNWSRRNIYSGAKVVAYNETENVLNPGKYLPSITVKSQDDGSYIIPDVIVGNTYYVYVFVPERPVYYRLIYVSTNTVSNVDFDIKPSTPNLKITMKRTENPYVFRFIIESPRPLASVPECYYSAGSTFNPDKKIRALPSKGAKNTYNLDIEIPQNSGEENYTLYIKAQYGVTEHMTETITFSQKSVIKTKKEISNELAEGGSILIDDERSDNTEVQVTPGTFTPEEFATMPIGGFLSSLPNFRMSKTSREIARMVDVSMSNIVASDVYEISLNKAQVNKPFDLAINYDRSKVKEDEIKDLRVYKYNPITDKWEVVEGVNTIDPLTGTVSVETDTLETSSQNKLSPKTEVKNGVFALRKSAATSQTGIFAVFKQDPNTARNYTGTEIIVYNFPNPFDLKQKNVVLTDVNSSANQTVKGTVIKYALPSGKGGEVKFYIYNLAGELVKTINEGIKDGGKYWYTEWDGTNDNNEDCASGVYFMIMKIDGKKVLSKPVKMAIVK